MTTKTYDPQEEALKGAESFLAKECPCCGHKMGFHSGGGCTHNREPAKTGYNVSAPDRCSCQVRVHHPARKDDE